MPDLRDFAICEAAIKEAERNTMSTRIDRNGILAGIARRRFYELLAGTLYGNNGQLPDNGELVKTATEIAREFGVPVEALLS